MTRAPKVTVQFLRRAQSCFVRVLWTTRFVETIKLSPVGYERAKRRARYLLGDTVTTGTFRGQLATVLELVATIDTFADDFRRLEVMK